VIVKIPQPIIDAMRAHARDAEPHECCGLLIGTRRAVSKSIRTQNLDTNPARYLVDPKDHLDAIKAARAESLRVIGAYHSHPGTSTEPSPSDIDEASGGADFLYVIVSPVSDSVTAYFVKNGTAVFAEVEPAAN